MSPVRAEPREPNPEDTVSRLELRSGFPLFEDGQLLTVGHVFGGERGLAREPGSKVAE